MKQEPENQESRPEKTFAVALEQMAQLLRTQVKKRAARLLPSAPLSVSFKNALEQIAKLLRKEIQQSKPSKKRSWKNRNKS